MMDVGFKLLRLNMALNANKVSLYALISSPISKYQSGGIVRRVFSMVGETGKELVITHGCSNEENNMPSSRCYIGCDFGFDSHSALLKADKSINGTFRVSPIAYHLHTHEPTNYHHRFNFESLPPLDKDNFWPIIPKDQIVEWSPLSLPLEDIELKARIEFGCKIPKH